MNKVSQGYIMSETLSQQIDNMNDTEKEATQNYLEGYIEQYEKAKKQHNTESAVYSFLKHIDEQIADARQKDKTHTVQCLKGCSHCCHINVDISHDEAILIKEWCSEYNIPIDKKTLAKQAKYSTKTYSQQEHSKCVFLKDNLCTIYEARPAACRKYMVFTDPVLCNTENINKVGFFAPVIAEIITSAMHNCSDGGSMAKMLLEVIK